MPNVLFKCPFPDCDYVSNTLYGLRKHFLRKHLNDECPICGQKYKNLCKHASQRFLHRNDLDHAVIYYLTANARTRRSSLFFKARIIAYEKLVCKE